ncbi:MAG: hypothetical protein O3C29_14455 [Proteobacteria bacterium]|nr:hypothetical protein [Pseudomonadota bacterium]MDA1291303.1 hypothetical protein [Pseudomonadota bacterium]
MIKRYIVTALVLLMLAPVNAGASAWMAESAPGVGPDKMAMAEMHMAGHDHKAMMDSSAKQSMMDAHDHGSEDCDDYCMNCSNHCSSTAITPSSGSTFERDRKFNRTITGNIFSRSSKLYRPPIFA